MRDKQDSQIYDTSNHLAKLGWSEHFQAQWERFGRDGLLPARIVGVEKNTFRASDGQAECLASLAGRLQHDAGGLYPVTGDWVLMAEAVIAQVLPRKNALARGAAGARGKQDAQPQREQVLAANLDSVCIVCGLDRDYNPRRIERYLTLVYNCGLNPVIILTKADLHHDPERFAGELESVAFGAPVHLVSATDDAGLAELAPHLAPGRTTTLVGSSGAGKSTLINRLMGRDVQATSAVSAQLGKGRHTTTSRSLITLPQGGMVIDNPGIREIAFWDVDQGIEAAFPEIEELGRGCRFADCTHTHEPGCLVLAAVDQGELDRRRVENYWKMQRELDYLASRRHKSADRVEKERWKDVALKIKAMKKRR